MGGLLATTLLTAIVAPITTDAVDRTDESRTGGAIIKGTMEEFKARYGRKEEQKEVSEVEKILGDNLLKKDSVTQDDLQDLQEDGYLLYDLRGTESYQEAHIPMSYSVDPRNLDIEGDKVVIIINEDTSRNVVLAVMSEYKPAAAEVLHFNKYDGELYNIQGKKVESGLQAQGESRGESISRRVEESNKPKPSEPGRTAPTGSRLDDKEDKPEDKKEVDGLVILGTAASSRSGEKHKTPDLAKALRGESRRQEQEDNKREWTSSDVPELTASTIIQNVGDVLVDTKDKVNTGIKQSLEVINREIESLREKSIELVGKLNDSDETVTEETVEGTQGIELGSGLTNEDTQVPESRAGSITPEETEYASLEDELVKLEGQMAEQGMANAHSQYGVYMGEGLFIGLGGSAFATVGKTQVHFDEESDTEGLEFGHLYHFKTNGMVALSYPSQISGVELVKVEDQVAIETSQSILRGIEELQKEIAIQVVNVGKMNQVEGEIKVSLDYLESTEDELDPYLILVVTGDSLADVERATEILQEKGSKAVIKITNFANEPNTGAGTENILGSRV